MLIKELNNNDYSKTGTNKIDNQLAAGRLEAAGNIVDALYHKL
jgi:hypothetical protein